MAARSPNLTLAQVQQLQAKVHSNADDVQSRARLLGFYFLNQDAPGGGIAARREQILWMIHNRPEDHLTGSPFCEIDPATDADGYSACKALWKQISEKQSPPTAVLQNAVRFFISSDPRLAENILKRATDADPDNPLYHQQMAEIYSNPMFNTVPAQENARRALEEMEKAFVLTKAPEEKFYILTELPKTALACGDNVKTADYARQLVADAPNFKKNWNYGNAIHKGNLALGIVALSSGDIETANARLLDAGKTPGSPQLNSFGPNMELAKRILIKGQKQTVLQYLDLCGKFWKMDNGNLDAWRKTIKAGQVPDFGGNLLY